MKTKAKFLDIGTGETQLNLGTLEMGPGDAALTADAQTIAGKKEFETVPSTGAGLTPTDLPAGGIGVVGYITDRLKKLVGFGVSEERTVTADEIAMKGLILTYPVDPEMFGSVVVWPENGPELARGIDFEVWEDGTAVTWDGYSIDGTIQAGDVLTLAYKTSSDSAGTIILPAPVVQPTVTQWRSA